VPRRSKRIGPSLTTLHRQSKTLNLSISTLLSKDLVGPWTILRRGERAVIDHASGTGGEWVKAEMLIPSVGCSKGL
jgi:hypothetical protein